MEEELKALKELLDMGAISREEYEAKKTELLREPIADKQEVPSQLQETSASHETDNGSNMSHKGTDNKSGSRSIVKKIVKVLAISMVCFFLVSLCSGSCSGSGTSGKSASSSSSYSSSSSGSSSSGSGAGSGSSSSGSGAGSGSSSSGSGSSSKDVDSNSSKSLLDYKDDVYDDGENLIIPDGKGGAIGADKDGNVFRTNSDGTTVMLDKKGNGVADTDGDGKVDSISKDGGKTWSKK